MLGHFVFTLWYCVHKLLGTVQTDESLFLPSKRKRQVNEELIPIFFDELNITDKVRMACEGSPGCIFDLITSGDMELAMETLNHEKETNVTEAIISKLLG